MNMRADRAKKRRHEARAQSARAPIVTREGACAPHAELKQGVNGIRDAGDCVLSVKWPCVAISSIMPSYIQFSQDTVTIYRRTSARIGDGRGEREEGRGGKRPPTPDLRLPTSDFRPRTSDFRPPIGDGADCDTRGRVWSPKAPLFSAYFAYSAVSTSSSS